MRSRTWWHLLLAALLLTIPAPLAAQSAEARIRAQREELERIRRERADLERRMSSIQGNVHELREEVAILDRQREATERVIQTLDRQLAAITTEVDLTTARTQSAERELAARRTTLERRLVEIYKRGPLYSAEALLTARSFGELVARYKYLHELATHDRALVTRVQTLRDQVVQQRADLVRLRDAVEENRMDKQLEEDRLARLRGERTTNLQQVQRSAQDILDRLAALRASESRLSNVIATIETERRRTAAARPNAPRESSTLRTSDLGRLDWPVDGTVLYRFGRVVNPNNTTTRWNGIGIAAPTGTAVRAVAPGTVVSVGQLGTYGLTVIVQHGAGDYSVYASLAGASVRTNTTIRKGDAIGTVGTSDPDLRPHLHFEIRPQGRAVDPESWLRGTR
ncbi:MAG TPA: peptidoglycan DD-metalloendopeptidase family protein [Gemmatimonadaceae bacterium]|nr:peptidoglycan DD-metalloendopeptidase family protein [Gemmatimonadaceae bacterium]